MGSNLSNFNIQTYRRFLAFLKKKYKIIPFCRFSRRDASFLILRHDIEVSLDAALQMARVEKECGVMSTYFVYLSNNFYNMFDPKNLVLLRRISRMGHEIGIHYDLVQYRSYGRPLQQTLLTEIHILEQLIRRKVHSIAMHNRSLYKSDPFVRIAGYINAYSFNKDHDVFYVSDSCRAWRIGDAHTLIAKNPKRVQLLIHPFQWIPNAENRYSLLDKWFKILNEQNNECKRQWKKLWRSIPHITKYDKEIKSQRRLLDFC